MITWNNLLDGTSFYNLLTSTGTMISDFFNSRILQRFFIDCVDNMHNFVSFWFTATTSTMIKLVLFIAFWYLVFVPTIRALARWR